MKRNKMLGIVIAVNILIFAVTNLIFNIKYEQVDDFIIYNLYSGLDGTYNIHGIYIHPLICMVLSVAFRLVPSINWHSIFLLSMQFICFTIIGYKIVKKQEGLTSILMYIIFASVFYSSLLLLIQYTSVATLLILTALFIIVDLREENRKSTKWEIVAFILFSIGVMTRLQSLFIIVPFFAIYLIYYLIKLKKKTVSKEQIIKLIKNYIIFIIITIIVYTSNLIIYNINSTYKKFMEFTDLRVILQDLSKVNYNENQEIFEKIGWSENDYYLFYTFNFGDENVYNNETLQKIVDYKKENGDYYNLNLKISSIVENLKNEITNSNICISILFLGVAIVCILRREKFLINIFTIFVTIATHIIFIILNRSMLRVVIPEYIMGTAILIYNLNIKPSTLAKNIKQIVIASIIIPLVIVNFVGANYNFEYIQKSYSNYKELIEYTNSHKENVYLYTVPALQYRYLIYSVYEMPPKSAFSNLRVMGGWDMYTENYNDFKDRYNLSGTFMDLLKDNVYLIDGTVTWSGNTYENYIENIILFIKEHYNIDVKYDKIEEFENLYVYKLQEKDSGDIR